MLQLWKPLRWISLYRKFSYTDMKLFLKCELSFQRVSLRSSHLSLNFFLVVIGVETSFFYFSNNIINTACTANRSALKCFSKLVSKISYIASESPNYEMRNIFFTLQIQEFKFYFMFQRYGNKFGSVTNFGLCMCLKFLVTLVTHDVSKLNVLLLRVVSGWPVHAAV